MSGLEFNEPAFNTEEDAREWIKEARLKGWRTSEPIRAIKGNGEAFYWVQARRNKDEQKANRAK